jgi:hypothetical protein
VHVTYTYYGSLWICHSSKKNHVWCAKENKWNTQRLLDFIEN